METSSMIFLFLMTEPREKVPGEQPFDHDDVQRGGLGYSPKVKDPDS
jgi:hypothetical protein